MPKKIKKENVIPEGLKSHNIKPEKGDTKELLNVNEFEKELTISSRFALTSVTLKEMRWNMKIHVYQILPRTYHKYTIKFLVDEEPFESRIKSLDQKREKINSDPVLFDKFRDKDMKDIDSMVMSIRHELAEIKRQCDTIEFVAEIEELKYKDGHTIVTMKIPDNIIEPLNKAKMLINYYRANLLPLL